MTVVAVGLAYFRQEAQKTPCIKTWKYRTYFSSVPSNSGNYLEYMSMPTMAKYKHSPCGLLHTIIITCSHPQTSA